MRIGSVVPNHFLFKNSIQFKIFNKDFKGDYKKLKEKSIIAKYFTYSIIEVFDIKTEKTYVIRREKYWKKVFQTVEFGMNN